MLGNKNPKPLDPDDIHLWVAETNGLQYARLESLYLPLLDDDEYSRYRCFKFAEHRLQFLISHALLRLTLSQYEEAISPPDWRFTLNLHGRPEIANEITLPLRFNLSHTKGIALCAVTLKNDIGADIENCQRTDLDASLEKIVLSRAECNALNQSKSGCRMAYFLKYWTLKEAYLKARGTGLTIPPNQISYDLTVQKPIVRFHPALKDNPSDWRFTSLNLSNRYIAAVAVRGSSHPCLEIQNDYKNLFSGHEIAIANDTHLQ